MHKHGNRIPTRTLYCCHATLYMVQFCVLCSQFHCTPQYSVHSTLCTVYIVHSVDTVHSTVLCTVYTVHSVLCAQSGHCTQYSSVHTVHSVLCAQCGTVWDKRQLTVSEAGSDGHIQHWVDRLSRGSGQECNQPRGGEGQGMHALNESGMLWLRACTACTGAHSMVLTIRMTGGGAGLMGTV